MGSGDAVVTQGYGRWADGFGFGGKVDDLEILTMTMMMDLGEARR